MPAGSGLLFLVPAYLFTWMLSRVPLPDLDDQERRGERTPMTRADRAAMLRRHFGGIAAIVSAYLLVTIARGMRADFAPEIWKALGSPAVPATFSSSEFLVALGVLIANGLSVLIVDNRRTFFASIGVELAGCALFVGSLLGLQRGWIGPFSFMVMLGLGLYLPYVAMHTTLFERLIAMTRERGNLDFLIYVADAAGYLAYASLVLVRGWLPVDGDPLRFFLDAWWCIRILTSLSHVAAWAYFATRSAPPPTSEVLRTHQKPHESR